MRKMSAAATTCPFTTYEHFILRNPMQMVLSPSFPDDIFTLGRAEALLALWQRETNNRTITPAVYNQKYCQVYQRVYASMHAWDVCHLHAITGYIWVRSVGGGLFQPRPGVSYTLKSVNGSSSHRPAPAA
jgi:hypothetical protein